MSESRFEIVNPNWTLPNGQPAQLARTSEGRLIARQVNPGVHGKPSLSYWQVPEDTRADVRALGGTGDELYQLQMALDRARAQPSGPPGLLAESPLEIEAAEFCRAWPHIGHRLGLSEIKVDRAFDIGAEVWRPSPSPAERKAIGDVDWKAFLDLHGSGDFGDFGKLADVGPLTEEQAFSIGLEPQAVRDAEAIRSGLGVVRSEWRDNKGPGGVGFVVRVATALFRDARRNFTWITFKV